MRFGSRGAGAESLSATTPGNGDGANAVRPVSVPVPSREAIHEAAHAAACVHYGWQVTTVDLHDVNGRSGRCGFIRRRGDELAVAIEDMTMSQAANLAEHAYGPPEPPRPPASAEQVNLVVRLAQDGSAALAEGWACYAGNDDASNAWRVASRVTGSNAEAQALINFAAVKAQNLVANPTFRDRVLWLARALNRDRELNGANVVRELNRAEVAAL